MSLRVVPSPTDSGPLAPVVGEGDPTLVSIRFDLLRPLAGQRLGLSTGGCEHVAVVLGGTLKVSGPGAEWADLGRRAHVFDGPAAAFYMPLDCDYWLEAVTDRADVALLRFPARQRFEPFAVRPEEVETVDVGQAPCHRQLQFLVGPAAAGRVQRPVVLEVFTDPGHWAGTPPHKHDADRPPEETAVEELYHYRFDPPGGFGVQCLYTDASDRTASIVRDGDTALLPAGYHPVSTLPGYRMYYLVAMAGRTGREVVQYFDPAHRWQLDDAPGVDTMRSRFRGR